MWESMKPGELNDQARERGVDEAGKAFLICLNAQRAKRGIKINDKKFKM